MNERMDPVAIDFWDGLAPAAEVPADEARVMAELEALFSTPLPGKAHDRSLQALRLAFGSYESAAIAAPSTQMGPMARFPARPHQLLPTHRPHQRRLFAAIAASLLLLFGSVFAYWNVANPPQAREEGGVIPAATGLDEAGWSVFRGNSSRDGMTNERGPTSEPTILWQMRVGGSTKQSPVVANGIVYVGSSNHKLFALDASTGAQLWEYEGDSSLEMTPAVANGLVYIPSANGTLVALDERSGSLRWTFGHPLGPYATPAIEGKTLFAGSLQGVLYAIDGITGAVKWSFETAQPFQRAVAAEDGVIYAGNDDGNLYALNASNGELIWSYETGRSPLGMPVVANNEVYLVEPGGGLIIVDAATGTYLRTFESPTTGQLSPPSVTNAFVIAGGGINGNQLHVYDVRSGNDLGGIGDTYAGPWLAAPAVASGVVYAADVLGHVLAANPVTREVIWTYRVKTKPNNGVIESGPAVANGVVFVATDLGMVYALK